MMEILGTPQEHVDSTAKLLVDKIKEREKIELLKSNISSSKEVKVSEDQPENVKFFSAIVEVDIKVGLSTRVSLVRVMEHLKVEKVQPRRPKDNAEKKTEK